MPPDRAAGQIRAHVGKFCDRDQKQNIELAGQLACARPWR
jgi:hypothetical protein